MDIIKLRVLTHHLLEDKFSTPEEIVAYYGAIQAQDYQAAKWSVGLRLKSAADSKIEEAVNEGRIIRTHVMRPTWHFIMPEDVVWMEKLTSPRVKTILGHYNRKLELTDELFKRTNSLITRWLKGKNYLTRQEIKKLLEKEGIKTDIQRLAHIVFWAELDGLIVSGPRREKRFTYALVDERIPKSRNLGREESLSTLALRYFTSHGPAQLIDFAWWSGLTMKDSKEGLESIKSKLEKIDSDGKTYWFLNNSRQTKDDKTTALFMSIFDEYVIAYTDRGDISENRNDIQRMLAMGNALTSVLVLDGKVAGTWKRLLKKNSVEIKVSPFRNLPQTQKKAIDEAANAYSDFLGQKAEVQYLA